MKAFGLKNILLSSSIVGNPSNIIDNSAGINPNVKNTANSVTALNTVPTSSQSFFAPAASINGYLMGVDCQQTVTFSPYKPEAATEALSPEFAKYITAADQGGKQDANNGIGNAITGFLRNSFDNIFARKSQYTALPCNRNNGGNADSQYLESDSELVLGDLRNLFSTEAEEKGVISSKKVKSIVNESGNDDNTITIDETGKEGLYYHSNNNLAATDSLLQAFDTDAERKCNSVAVESDKQGIEDEEIFYDAYSNLADLDSDCCVADGSKNSKIIADFAHKEELLPDGTEAAAIEHFDRKMSAQSNNFGSALQSFNNSSNFASMPQKDSALTYENKTSPDNVDTHNRVEQNLLNTKEADRVILLGKLERIHQATSSNTISSDYKTAEVGTLTQSVTEGSAQKQDVRLSADGVSVFNAGSFDGSRTVAPDNHPDHYSSPASSAATMQDPNAFKTIQLSHTADSTSMEKLAEIQEREYEAGIQKSSPKMQDTKIYNRDVKKDYTSNSKPTKKRSGHSNFFRALFSFVWDNSFAFAAIAVGIFVTKPKGILLKSLPQRDSAVNTPAGAVQLSDVVNRNASLQKTTNSFRINKRRVAGVLGTGFITAGVVTSGAIWYITSAVGGLLSVAIGIAVPVLCIAGIGGLAIYGLPMIKSWLMANKSRHSYSNVNDTSIVCSENSVAINKSQVATNGCKNETGNTQNDEDAAKDLDNSNQCNTAEFKSLTTELRPVNGSCKLQGDIEQFIPKHTLQDFLSFFNPQLNKEIGKLKQRDWEKLLTCLEPFLSKGFFGLRKIFRSTIFCWYRLRECFAQVGLLSHMNFSEWLAEELLNDFDYQDFSKLESICCITRGFLIDHTTDFCFTEGNKTKVEKADSNNTIKPKSSINSTINNDHGDKNYCNIGNDETYAVANFEQDSKDIGGPSNFLSNISISGLDNAVKDNLSLMEA